MADTLVERLTGQASAQEVEVQVVITDEALFGSDETPGQVPGYGTVPAGWVRDLLNPADDNTNHTNQARPGEAGPADSGADSAATGDTATSAGPERGDSGTPAAEARRATTPRGTTGADSASLREHARVWLRRLYAHPTTGQLVAMDSTRRVFDGNLRKFLLARDAGICRTPWCDAPIRHLDHVTDHALGGPTTAQNGQGLCVRCNHTKQLPGFTARTITPEPPATSRTGDAPAQSHSPRHAGWDPARLDERHTVELTTPTGHTYPSTAPPLIPGKAPPQKTALGATGLHPNPTDPPLSPFERYLTDLIAG